MKKLFLVFFALSFLAFGCSKKRAPQYSEYGGGAEFSRSTARTPGLAYDDSATLFSETSNLYGKMSDENAGSPAAASRAKADEPGYIAENVERKIVRRANIRVRVENLETAEISIKDLMEKYDAYAAWTSADEDSRRYTIRVPSAVYREFLAGTAGMGKVITRTESAEDVTLRYYDLEGRLGTNKELLKTFQAYLGKAKNIEEILSVERRIAELQSEIDSTGKDLRRLSNDVDYSTVELYIFESGVAVTRYPSFLDNVKGLFRSFGEFLSVLAVILIGIVVYGVPIVLLLVFFFWLLFGKIGLLKKLWRLAAGRKKASEDSPHE